MDSSNDAEPSFFRRRWKILLGVGLGIAVIGLGPGLGAYFGTKGSDDKVPVNYIDITSDSTILCSKVGDTFQLKAVVKRPDGTVDDKAKFSYSSSNDTIATVDSNGLVTCQTSDLSSAVITVSSSDSSSHRSHRLVFQKAVELEAVEANILQQPENILSQK